ncbi:MAG: hypothetical protein PF693_14255 [Spirochaetia bacterium]|nr:hypothetical protein [Spirochaetia bacterium]
MSDVWNGFESDSQGSEVIQVEYKNFDFERYADYEESGRSHRGKFVEASEGFLIHRRFRVPRVFSWGSADMEESLKWQLGALTASMDFPMDIPNFLEPWYGIGTVASCFGAEYVWKENQAPVFHPQFSSISEALKYEPIPVEKTAIGKRTLDMIEFFLDKTKGQVPLSLTDTQSPLNIAASLVDTTTFLLSLYDDPDGVTELIEKTVSLNVEFTQKQQELIGKALVYPGHGFASCREFTGLGMSDDTSSMMSPDQFEKFVCSSIGKTGAPFGGAVYHSCGNWTQRLKHVMGIDGLKAVDAAFTFETDCDPNPVSTFTSEMVNTGIILNARCAGLSDKIEGVIKELIKPGMKTVLVTYARTPQEQQKIIESLKNLS